MVLNQFKNVLFSSRAAVATQRSIKLRTDDDNDDDTDTSLLKLLFVFNSITRLITSRYSGIEMIDETLRVDKVRRRAE